MEGTGDRLLESMTRVRSLISLSQSQANRASTSVEASGLGFGRWLAFLGTLILSLQGVKLVSTELTSSP